MVLWHLFPQIFLCLFDVLSWILCSWEILEFVYAIPVWSEFKEIKGASRKLNVYYKRIEQVYELVNYLCSWDCYCDCKENLWVSWLIGDWEYDVIIWTIWGTGNFWDIRKLSDLIIIDYMLSEWLWDWWLSFKEGWDSSNDKIKWWK